MQKFVTYGSKLGFAEPVGRGPERKSSARPTASQAAKAAHKVVGGRRQS